MLTAIARLIATLSPHRDGESTPIYGYWGHADTRCCSREPLYGTSPYVAEWRNTLSNAAFFAAAAWRAGVYGAVDPLVIPTLVCGCVSAAYHATARECCRRADIAAVLFSAAYLACLMSRGLYWPKNMLAASAVGVASLLLNLYDALRRPLALPPNLHPLWHLGAALTVCLL